MTSPLTCPGKPKGRGSVSGGDKNGQGQEAENWPGDLGEEVGEHRTESTKPTEENECESKRVPRCNLGARGEAEVQLPKFGFRRGHQEIAGRDVLPREEELYSIKTEASAWTEAVTGQCLGPAKQS